jgi:hypothetical protein
MRPDLELAGLSGPDGPALFAHGIQTEDSHIWAHVSVAKTALRTIEKHPPLRSQPIHPGLKGQRDWGGLSSPAVLRDWARWRLSG